MTAESNKRSAADGLASLGSAITSPAKLAFLGYVILAATDSIATSVWQFVVVTIVFLVIQIIHDDYLRIRLNECRLHSDKARRASGY